MAGWQKWIGVGNLGRDAEKKATPSGQTVVSFSMAITEAWRDGGGQKQEKTLWANVSYWGKAGEAVHQYLTKGKPVLVEGTASVRAYQGRDGNPGASFDVRASRVVLLGSAREGTSDDAGQSYQPQARPAAEPYYGGHAGLPEPDLGPESATIPDEDLPF